MKTAITHLFALACIAGTSSAASVIVTDGDGNAYGDAAGFRIDFDSTTIPVVTSTEGVNAGASDWSPALVSGQSYSLDSVSIRYSGAQAVTTPKYVGVYTGFEAGVLSGFQGVSNNAVDFALATSGTWHGFAFSSISLTVDSTVGSGSGLLYFVFQTGTSAVSALETTVGLQRNNGFPGDDQMPVWHSNILAFGAVQTTRAAEYQATLTAVPEPSSFALALGGAGLMIRRRRNRR